MQKQAYPVTRLRKVTVEVIGKVRGEVKCERTEEVTRIVRGEEAKERQK